MNTQSASRFERTRKRAREKGAALVTVVLLSMLLITAAGAIILVTVLSNTTTVDVVAEKQAYSAAEAGMQMTLNILRGNSTGVPVSFKSAAVRTTSNKADDWMPRARLSNWLTYSYPTTNPDRVPLTSPYTPFDGLAFSVIVEAPDAVTTVIPTPNPTWVDGPVVKPDPPVKPPRPAWHPWHCAHCSWDYTHCSLYNPPNNGTLRADGMGCRHKHCIPPPNWGGTGDDGYERLILRVTGYGPRGARKELELMVERRLFEYAAEPIIYIRGSDDSSVANINITGTPTVTFDSGDKIAFMSTKQTDIDNLTLVTSRPDKMTIAGKGDDFELANSGDIPGWLESADNAREMVAVMEEDAKARGRWYTSYPAGSAGTDGVPEVTFVRGDANISSNGAGILIVTGNITFSNNADYKGLVLALGSGTISNSSGDSTIEGGVLMAKFGSTGGFLSSAFNFSGGTFTIKTNATRLDAAMDLINLRIIAVRES